MSYDMKCYLKLTALLLGSLGITSLLAYTFKDTAFGALMVLAFLALAMFGGIGLAALGNEMSKSDSVFEEPDK